MIQDFFLSIGQLGDRRIASVFLKSLFVTLLLFAALGFGLWYGMRWLAAVWFDATPGTASLADLATLVAMLLAGWLLFRAVAVAVIGIFGDEVVMAVEAKHYPAAFAQARDVPFARSVAMGLGSASRAIMVNLLFSPIYLVLIFVLPGVGTAVAFFLVNSWLLGRDLGDMVAARHMQPEALPAWRGRTGFRRFTLGAAGTGLFMVPIVNLLAPVVGAAMATHSFHRSKRK